MSEQTLDCTSISLSMYGLMLNLPESYFFTSKDKSYSALMIPGIGFIFESVIRVNLKRKAISHPERSLFLITFGGLIYIHDALSKLGAKEKKTITGVVKPLQRIIAGCQLESFNHGDLHLSKGLARVDFAIKDDPKLKVAAVINVGFLMEVMEEDYPVIDPEEDLDINDKYTCWAINNGYDEFDFDIVNTLMNDELSSVLLKVSKELIIG